MKRLLALLLVLAAILSTGCTQKPEPTTQATEETTEAPTTQPPTTEEPTTETTEAPTMANQFFDPEVCAELIDTWSVDVVLDGNLLNFTDMESSVTMKLCYQFNDDGTYVRGVEQEEYDTAIAAYESFIHSYMLGMRYTVFVAEKKMDRKTEEQIAQEWEQTGWPQAQQEVDAFVEGLHLNYRFSSLNRSGDYYVENGIVYLSYENGSYEACPYEKTEEGLTLLNSTDPEIYTQVKLEFPLTLTNGTQEAAPEETEETTAEAAE